MLRRQSLIALGVAVMLGILAVYLANSFLEARVANDRAGHEGMTRVAVAAAPLDFGQPVTTDKVRFVDYPSTSLPAGVFTTPAALVDNGNPRVALRPIGLNQPILAGDVTGAGQAASIAALLPDGMRAVTVQVDAVTGVAGFVVPNDTVDVLITREPLARGGVSQGRPVTDVLLQNVRVMATDQRQKADNGQPAVSSTATLEVSPIDAQKLVLGQQLGRLSFVLRKPGVEQNVARVETVSLDDLRYTYATGLSANHSMIGAASTAPAAPVKVTRLAPRPRPTAARRPVSPAPVADPTHQVEVTRGTNSSTYEVGGYAR